jgi:para-nitrobenzyl esterase
VNEGRSERNHDQKLNQASQGLSRRNFVFRTGMSVLAPAILTSKLRAQSGSGEVIAKTVYGRVRGARKEGVLVFKGIPYADPPTGENRFKPPAKPWPWKGVRDALVYGPQSIQAEPSALSRLRDAEPVSSEDCLYLNVWTPGIAEGRDRPVMFYNHGGGFISNNAGDEGPYGGETDGAALAKDYDVVVVSHNHRLGLMGYLFLGDLLGEEYAASGLVGMLDIAAALQWVHDNISEFGGDPERVMIFGVSGGGQKTATLTAMPCVQGLYHLASVESGPLLRFKTRDAANEMARATLAGLGLSKNQARELLAVPAGKFRDLQASLLPQPPPPPAQQTIEEALLTQSQRTTTALGFCPMLDGHYLPAHPYDPVAPAMSARIPMIIGTTKDEMVATCRSIPEVVSFDMEGLRRNLEPTLKANTSRVIEVYQRTRPHASPAELFVAITTARVMRTETTVMAERKLALKGAPVYMYIFSYEPEVSPTGALNGASHGSDVPFRFEHVPGDRSSRRVRAAKAMSGAWAAFACTGNPNHAGIPNWHPYTLAHRSTMFFDAECQVIDDPDREERLLWASLA